MEIQGVIVAHLGSHPNDRERSSVLEGVGQVLITLLCLSPGCSASRTHIFDQTLAETDQTWKRDNNRDDYFAAAGPVGFGGCGEAVGEEHAEADV